MLDVLKIRKDFPILSQKINGKDLVYLDSGATSQKPTAVIEAINKFYRETNANIHRGVYSLSVESTRLMDEARNSVASFLGAKEAKEIIFVRNATEAINLVRYSWGEENISEGDAVITTKLEHHSNFVPWQDLCQRKKAELRVVEVNKEGRLEWNKEVKKMGEEDVLRVSTGGLEDLIDEKVKLVAISGQSNALGTIVPLDKIVKLVHEKSPKALILVDGAQLVPHTKVEVTKMGIDFLVFSGHKCLGPTGTGVLWGKKDVLEKMRPFLLGGDMISEVRLEKTTWAELPNKFEAGTPDIAGAIGLGAAVRYLMDVGMEQVRSHEKELTKYALDKMKVLEDEGIIELYGVRNEEERGAAISFNVKGVHAHDAAQVLDNFGICVRSGQHCAAPLVNSFGVPAMVRATMYLYNTTEEIDFLADKIREIPKVFI